jgi:hypothetical protein
MADSYFPTKKIGQTLSGYYSEKLNQDNVFKNCRWQQRACLPTSRDKN